MFRNIQCGYSVFLVRDQNCSTQEDTWLKNCWLGYKVAAISRMLLMGVSDILQTFS